MKDYSVSLPVSIFKEGKSFVAYSPIIDLSTCGNTLAEAKTRFEELVKIFFEELERMGTTEEVLTSLGWKKIDNEWDAPVEVSHEVETFRLPVGA